MLIFHNQVDRIPGTADWFKIQRIENLWNLKKGENWWWGQQRYRIQEQPCASSQSMKLLPGAWEKDSALSAASISRQIETNFIIPQCFTQCTLDNSPLILETSQSFRMLSLPRENVNCGPRNDCWSSSVASKTRLLGSLRG